jgi:hypothetical protein
MTVVVDAGHIVSVDPKSSRSAQRGAQVISGRGRFLIPGLWDMHVHVVDAGEGALAEAVAAGVTGIRDLGGELSVLDVWRREIASGERVGPLILRAGPVLDGINPEALHRVTVLDSARAVFVVDSLAALGVDCIKVHASLPRAAFFATVAEARRRHLPVAAHLPTSVTAAEASDAGAASLEHVAETLLGSAINDPRHPAKTMKEAIAANRGARGDSLFRKFVANGTAFDPTLVAYRSFVNWPGTAPESRVRRAAVLDSQVLITGRMHEIGVRLLTGTDLTPRQRRREGRGPSSASSCAAKPHADHGAGRARPRPAIFLGVARFRGYDRARDATGPVLPDPTPGSTSATRGRSPP